MEQYKNLDIVEMPLGSPYFSDMVSRFLGANGLRMEAMDTYYAVQDADGNIIAGAGISGDIIKCVAVAQEARSEGLMVPMISRIVAGRGNLKVFTKPEYREVFESLGFRLLGQAPKAILLENGRGLEQYCARLRAFAGNSRTGVIVMNANPFTLGHRYLIERALEQVDHLVVIPVMEDVSMFPYKERLEMICRGVSSIQGGDVDVVEGSPYTISAATFPTYFLKDLTEASEQQMLLDLDIFSKHIAPALGATVRFVGSEPYDPLTARYNALMAETLPKQGIAFVEIPRLESISASKVRNALAEGNYAAAAVMCPATTHPYLLAALAERALRMELDAPLKPGLVCPDSNGAHKDMDYNTMLRGIKAIRPFFPAMARATDTEALRQLGIDAESAMLAATGGVNTHRGAIFAMGLVLKSIWRELQTADTQFVVQTRHIQMAVSDLAKLLIDSKLHLTAVGARQMALTGYQQLFEDWLQFYRNCRSVAGQCPVSGAFTRTGLRSSAEETGHCPVAIQQLLLHIMSTLDDTCIIKRVGKERAEKVKLEISGTSPKMTECSPKMTEDTLKRLCEQFAAEGISPGGAADMVALTIFIDSII